MQREDIYPKRRLAMCLAGSLAVLLLGSAALGDVYPYYPEISTKYLVNPRENALAISADGMYVAVGDNAPYAAGLEVYSHYGYTRGDLVASWQPATPDWYALAMAPAFADPGHFWVLHANGARSRFEPSLGAPLEQTGIPPTPNPVMRYCDLDVDSYDRQYFTYLTVLPNWNIELAIVTRYDPLSDQYVDRLVASGTSAKYCPLVSYDQVEDEVVVLTQPENPSNTPAQLKRMTPALNLLSICYFSLEEWWFSDIAVSGGWATFLNYDRVSDETRMRTRSTSTLFEDDNIVVPYTFSLAVNPGNQYAFLAVQPGSGFAARNYVIWH
ncbi:MAG: hypothetical protein AUK47_10800 [Deltaproteobacteria bacterium CG2_30_63_29]|nr:MAG: hypothetical protein AUK47_10800 [Deltaproteobacteria bacterium CG2_30_63_29]